MKPKKEKSLISDKIEFIDSEGKKHEIPPEGSLGLLALGAVGLIAWREKRREIEQNK